ncbi:arylsulfatase B [Drosophila miranda]|uniref:arylsulfatase B n=1 Tax=Drosophila miranda TaxID=7229 RepID=UPI0007E81895|nr:arylsulfatase B [Drosophila miranda]XP_033242850.1 arylsulfatase B [Drosophila miranda]XP_033242851.1 arylsulfatase B [Drosophila miranda]
MNLLLPVLLSLSAAISGCHGEGEASAKPNIIIILIDDMGFNDVSFHGSNQILTPNIDALAYNGILLNRHYVPNLCTPSRATLLTGKYPIHTGMQHFVIVTDEPWGLPRQERLMPELFRDAGYATHLVGKWHLGFWRKDLTPTMRGFDHHFGYYNGYMDYYDQTVRMLDRNYSTGLDFRRDLEPCREAEGTYATEAFTTEARKVIERHDKSRPLFMVLSHLAVHTGNEDNPMQAPEEEVAKFAHIRDPKRRTYAGMISSLDKSVGQTMRALADNGMLNNSIVLLYSDNGAPTVGIHSNAGSNYPFRGQKESPWEGGIRSVGALWSPLLQQRGYVSNQAIHAIDWLPTLAAAAGVALPSDLRLDGLNLWPSLSASAQPQPRNLLHVLDDVFGYSSYTQDTLKYVNGSSFEGRYDHWLGELEDGEEDPNSRDYGQLVRASEVQAVLGNVAPTDDRIRHMRDEATQRCPIQERDPEDPVYLCEPLKAACLFDLANDPCERYNLANLYPLQLQLLAQEVEELRLTALPSARVPRADDRADPALHDGHWEWWNNTLPGSSAAALPPSGPWLWLCIFNIGLSLIVFIS